MSKDKKLNRRDVRRIPGDDFIGQRTGKRQVYSGPMTLAMVWGRSCGGKIGYADRLDALREALIMGQQHHKPFDVYACGCCGLLHVGGVK